MYTYFILFIITIIIYLIFRRHKYYNYLNELKIENFQVKTPKKKIPNDLNFVFCSFKGDMYMIKDKKIWVVSNKNEILTQNENIDNFFKINYSIDIKTGTLYKKYLVIISDEDEVIIYDLIENEILYRTTIEKYFGTKIQIDKILYYNNLFHIFNNDDVIIIDKNKKKIIKKDKLNKVFKGINKNFSCVFINNQIILKNVPYGVPCFIEKKIISVYNPITKEVLKFDMNSGIKTNTEYVNIPFRNIKTNFKFDEDGDYRIICIGAGNEGGGYGGLVFNDFQFKKNDSLEMCLGGMGDRTPLKDKIISHDKLPYTSSSAGNGGSFVYKNNNLLMCAGGGGGWTSEIIRCPNISNSSMENKNRQSAIIVPIKKMELSVNKSFYSGIRNKIIVRNFDFNNYNHEIVNINVTKTPEKKNSKYKYETDFNEKGINKEVKITLEFSQVMSDYDFSIDCFVETMDSKDKQYCDLTIYDEQNRKIVLKDYSKYFNNFRLNVLYGVLLSLLGVTYLIILTSQFIDLKIHNCECSEDWKRVLLLYPLVPVAFGILSLLHVLIFKPNLLKGVVKRK